MRISRLCAWLAVLVFLYLVAVGQIDRLTWTCSRDSRLVRTLDAVYSPVIWARENNCLARSFLDWYATLWDWMPVLASKGESSGR